MFNQLTDILILAGEFIQHSVIIVLIGLLIVEYFITHKRPQSFLLSVIFFAVILLGVWDFLEFFILDEYVFKKIIEYAVAPLSLLAICYVAAKEWTRISHITFLMVVISAIVYFLIEVSLHFVYNDNVKNAHDLVRTIIFISAYFLTLQYFIAIRYGRKYVPFF